MSKIKEGKQLNNLALETLDVETLVRLLQLVERAKL